jgi:hypothetical protein
VTKVALIGNFVVPWCTEVHLARALRENGCEVAEYPQDNAFKIGPTAIVDSWLGIGTAKGWEDHSTGRPDLVMYVRTHSGTALGHAWTDGWTRLAHAGVKTAAFHLDRYFDLSREHLVHEHDPLFTMQHCFTADGGNDDRFASAGVNHHWLPPAVDRVEASWQGDRRTRYEFDVVFAGSPGSRYHGEYPQRGELIAHLRSVYGARFAHFGKDGDFDVVRGQALNDLYATAKVIVGDSCFANTTVPGTDIPKWKSDRYWSDRIPETLGRGGFLLHPYVPGVRDSYSGSELATYNPGDWDDLDAQIGAFLANPGEREGMVERGRARVLREHTYTHRMQTLLATVGLTPDPCTMCGSTDPHEHYNTDLPV